MQLTEIQRSSVAVAIHACTSLLCCTFCLAPCTETFQTLLC